MLGRLVIRSPAHAARSSLPRSPHHRPILFYNTNISFQRSLNSTSRAQQEIGQESDKAAKPQPAASKVLTRCKTVAKWSAFLCASSAIGIVLVGSAIFLHDALTYTERHVDRVPVNPLALHPEVGGPKKLPVAKVLVADEEDEENKLLSTKPRLVIVGGGWGVSYYLIVCV